ncbi:hypothetical protein [Planomonospora parontospora]|uniref:hypothetical protein n=1 Tax=Planomonospora parontospora TaxID=58119 RepID=UPI0016707D2F|nr:hypothetical protein [Planomonospora parontospora]
MNRYLCAAAAILTASTLGCSSTNEPLESQASGTLTPSMSPTSPPTWETTSPEPVDPLESFSAEEREYLKALEKKNPDDYPLEPDYVVESTLESGLEICGEVAKDVYDEPTKAPGGPNINRLIEIVDEMSYDSGGVDSDVAGPAFKYLCPEHAKMWKRAHSGFTEGVQTVGEDIKPGIYHTASGLFPHSGSGLVTDCYWERSTDNGDTIANDFIKNAPKGVTVTIRASDGGFTSEGCGNWLKIG